MADKSISELTAASQVGATDLFVLEQGSVAKKLTGQILENWLLAMAQGHGGIISLTKTGTAGLVDTYTITFSDDTYTTFTVTNGKGITSIEKTSTSGLTDTYTITYTDNTTKNFNVVNGKAISSLTDKWAVSSSNTQTPSTWYNTVREMTPTNRYLWHYFVIAYNDGTSVDTAKSVVGVYGDTGDATYTWIKYAAARPTRNADMTDTPSNWIGIYTGTATTAPASYTAYTWSQFKGDTGNGIASIVKTDTDVLEDTYTITMTDSTTATFTVTNGRSITDVVLQSTSGLANTYRISFNDETHVDFTVTNGKGITSITRTNTTGLVDTYTVAYNDGTNTTFTVTNGKGISQIRQTSSSGLVDTYTITYNDGTTSTFTVANGKSISTIELTSTSGLVDTYTVTFNDNTTTTFTVTNGSNISTIERTSRNGLVDTYTVTLTNGSTSTFTVTNAKSIASITQTSGTHAAGTTDTYTITFNDGDSSTFTVYNGANGEGAVSSVAGIGVVGDQGDVPLIQWGNGAPTVSTAGQLKQLYFDLTGGIMYICVGTGSTYTWASMGITVDNGWNSQSGNPLSNAFLAGKIGTGSLVSTFEAAELTSAVNELETDKAEKSATVSNVAWDNTNGKLTKTINGNTTDIVALDENPTSSSKKPVTSGGVYSKLAEKAPLASPAFTGTPTTPTPTLSDDSTKMANTAWVRDVMTAENTTYDDTLSTHTAGSVGEELASLKGSLNTVCLRAAVKTISGNGTSSNTLTGLTADHVVGNWGMFSDANCTIPIPENSPPCDITITTAANAWSVTIANYSSTFYLRPTFILKQN